MYPRVAIASWYALGFIGWSSLATLFLAIATAPVKASLWQGIHALIRGFLIAEPLKGLGLYEAVGLTLWFDLTTLLVGSWLVGALQLRRRRIRHGELLDLLAMSDSPFVDIDIIDHEVPLAYFVPGGSGRVVLSRGALHSFEPSELDAIIEHERGHRDGRHGLWILPLTSMTPFFAFIPYARMAPVAIRAHIEMAADDVAQRRGSLEGLCGALRSASTFGLAPWGTMAWDGSVVERRLARLESPRQFKSRALLSVVTLLVLAWAVVTAWLIH